MVSWWLESVGSNYIASYSPKTVVSYIFNSNHYLSFVRQLALNYLSLFLNSSLCPLVSFYFPEYCKSRMCDNNLPIWHAIFDAYDAIHTHSDWIPKASARQFIGLTSPQAYYTHLIAITGYSYIKPFSVVSFLFMILFRNAFVSGLPVCQYLYSDNLQTRIVKIQLNVWPYILEELPSPVDWSDHSKVTNIISFHCMEVL